MTTYPPKTRPGKQFAGGKRLRKALAVLQKRKANHAGKHATKQPGSMK